ncbi:S-layer family protein [Nostoc sp. TCL26-01]|uniref:two-partner secretion domain-containing protein n=1 Tax=Nostoc sp. TCL26-01 TaxID=2576904 RepID=UPI0015BB3F98|nr:S-layer family protein [Nostoc sp. TCL26-01]QLE54352.1 S-layer family protein [Nostoc sp. TCL26-01]
MIFVLPKFAETVKRFLGFGLVLSAFGTAFVGEKPVIAEIKEDTTLGNETSVLIQGVEVKGEIGDRIDGGAVRGNNLFHSFQEFSIDDGQRVYFSNPTGVENILTRITGQNGSNILGTLGVLGNANLFLINPNGIVFGQNARLDVAGSFIASTADSLVFDNGLLFSSKNPQPAPLLAVNVPLGLQLGDRPKDIQLQAAFLPGADGQTLGFVGGNIGLDGTYLLSFGGRVELGGLANAGTVGLDFSNNQFKLQFPEVVERADVSLVNQASINVTTENSGSIIINARNLELLHTSQINIYNNTSADADGSLLINAADTVFLTGINSAIGSLVISEDGGRGANLILNTRSLALVNGGQIYTTTVGQQKAGNLIINASDSVALEGLGYSNSDFTGIATQTEGTGDSGDFTLKTNRLSLTNGAQIGNLTVGEGNAGNVTIIAQDTIFLSEESLLASLVGTNGRGNGGKLSITTKSLLVTDGAQILTTTAGKGNAGNMTITASDSLVFDDKGGINIDTGAFSRVEPGAVGAGGNIDITTNSFSLLNNAVVDASTFGEGQGGNVLITAKTVLVNNGSQIGAGTIGQGNAGNIVINASDRAIFDGVITFVDLFNNISINVSSGAFTTVVAGAVGNGGDLIINTPNLALTNGAIFNSSTFGEGDAGDIYLNASNSIAITGASRIESFVNTEAVGDGGTIKLTTKILSVSDRSFIDGKTDGFGDAGNIEVIADILEVTRGGQLLTSTSSSNKAGNINLRVSDRITLADNDSGIFANTTATSTGNSGSIFIDPKILTIRDGAKIAVDNQGSGIGGTIDIQADRLILNNQAVISAETASNTGGDIKLNVPDTLLLRRNSRISTTAGTTQQSGDGGNIQINTKFIVASSLENNDITANAFTGNGGRVDITAQSIFGLTPRTRTDLERLLGTTDPTLLDPRSLSTSDITAISQANPSFSGEITINTPGVDPSSGLVALPANVVDAANLIAQTCRNTGATASKQSEFVVTGRGGLPPKPSDALSRDAIWQDLQTYTLPNENISHTQPHTQLSQPPIPIVEAQGWVISANGKVTLVAQAPNPTPHKSALTPVSCPVAQN